MTAVLLQKGLGRQGGPGCNVLVFHGRFPGCGKGCKRGHSYVQSLAESVMQVV
jgi:hypothetical protein